MDNSNQQDIKNNQTFRRSRHVLNPAVMFYVRMVVIFVCVMLFFLIFGRDVVIDKFPFFASLGLFFALTFGFGNSGSLVETVHIDYVKQEIRILRYTYLGRLRLVNIPFEGFSWEIWANQMFCLDRLMIFPIEGKRVAICKGGLSGWTKDDIMGLTEALSEIVPCRRTFG